MFATVDASAGYKGITAFLVEKDTAGFTVGRKEDKLGIRASSTCELILEDCAVPAAQVLGAVGQGIQDCDGDAERGAHRDWRADAGAGRGRVGPRGRNTQSSASSSARRWRSFRPCSSSLRRWRPTLRRRRLMVYNAARLKDARREFRKEAAMCKYFASQVAERVASLAVEVLGGAGFVKDSPVEKLYRDAKIGKIYEGTSFMQLAAIAKSVL